jgi:hypothetical protein
MRFDTMRLRGQFGTGPVDTHNGLHRVQRSSEERYEWDSPRAAGATMHPAGLISLGDLLTVARDATGPIPRHYGTPVRHASGVTEYLYSVSRGPFKRQSSLFVFPDNTWVQAADEIADRVRSTFAVTGNAPPLPAVDKDVAWELCGYFDANHLYLPFDKWSIFGNRVTARLFASEQQAELIYTFASPEQAASAAMAQSAQCTKTNCPWVKSAAVDGSLVRYGMHVRKAPTSDAIGLEIAEFTPPLSAPPPADAPVAPGAPPSGVYQQFVDFRSDTCPTRATGRKYPSMMDTVLIKHNDGKAFTTLPSAEPRERGMMTVSPMPNVELTVGSVTTKQTTHLCPQYAISRKMTVLTATGDTIRVRDEVRYVGSTVGCRNANLPSNCGHVAETTFVLARKSCDSSCDATLVGRPTGTGEGQPAPRIDVTCSCP